MVFGDHAVIAALRHAADGQDKHGEGRHLDTAARGAGGRADELEHAHEQLGDGPARRKVDGVHTRRAGRHRLEQRRHDLAVRGEAAHRFGVRPLHQGDEHRTADPQNRRESQHDLGVEGQAALFAPLAQLDPDHEAQAARHDEEHNDGLYIVIVDERHQRRILPEPAEQVKARIAERRDRREDADPDALQPELRHKGERQQHYADGLEQERQPDDDLQHLGRL